MIDSIITALAVIFSWPTILFVFIGTLIGVLFGALPGLGGAIALALLIPATFGMSAGHAMILLASTLGGVAFGGSVSAILINTPGTAPNAATCFDGYPMARQGRASEALGIAATASMLGAIFGLIVLVMLIPVSRQIIRAFSQPEFFLLAIFALTVIAVTSQDHLLKGLVSGGFGLMLGVIGYSDTTGQYRFGFDTEYLWDGIGLIPVIIGIFAIAEVFNLIRQGGTIAETEGGVEDESTVWTGVVAVLKRPSLFLRSSVIGVIIGMIPGVGGTVANFISYMQAIQTSKNPDSFGNGSVEGVIASEAANDSKDGGTLLPTVVFGIPGGTPTAVLLGGFILHGLTPGREMLEQELDILFMIIFALLMANILTSTIGILSSNYLSKITRVPVDTIAPAILVISLVGAFALRANIGDVIVAIAFGFIGFWMIVFNFSRIALIIALILTPIAERAFHISIRISEVGYLIFFTRPISLLLLFLTVASLSYPFIQYYRK